MDEGEFVREDPLVFCVVDFESAVGWDAGIDLVKNFSARKDWGKEGEKQERQVQERLDGAEIGAEDAGVGIFLRWWG